MTGPERDWLGQPGSLKMRWLRLSSGGDSETGHRHCIQGELCHGVPGGVAVLVTVNTKRGSRTSVDHLARAASNGSLDSDGPWDLHSGM